MYFPPLPPQFSRAFIALLIFLCQLSYVTAQQKPDSTPSVDDDEWNTESPYYRVMAENVIKLDTIISEEELYRVAATLERVARVEKSKALPHYYLGFVYATIAFREKDLDKIDEWCDRSRTSLAKAAQLGGIAEEEILVIRALIEYGRLQVDYLGRGMEATVQAEKHLLAGYKINPDHPRILSILGQHYLQIPPQIGGSRKKSCHYAELAREAYLAERASRPVDIFPIVPHWGEADILEVIEKFCSQEPAPAKTKK